MRCSVTPRWSQISSRSLGDVQRDVDHLLHHFFGGEPPAEAPSWKAPLSIWEDETHYHVEVDMPGVAADAVDVSLDKTTLKLVGERPAPTVERKYWHAERGVGRVERVVTLPETVDADSIDAKLQDGVLHVAIAKRPESQPKRVEIKTK